MEEEKQLTHIRPWVMKERNKKYPLLKENIYIKLKKLLFELMKKKWEDRRVML